MGEKKVPETNGCDVPACFVAGVRWSRRAATVFRIHTLRKEFSGPGFIARAA